MSKFSLLLLALLACAPAGFAVDPWVVPAPGEIPDSMIARAWRTSHLIVLGTALEERPDQVMALRLAIGSRALWWNVRLKVSHVYRGNRSPARYIDYGPLGPALTPPLPWRLGRDEIVVQRADRWRTAPIELGRPLLYFFRRCYNCAEIPTRMSRGRAFATPWVAALTLPAADTVRLRLALGSR